MTKENCVHPFPPLASFIDLIHLARREDEGAGDVTSQLTVPAESIGVGTLYQKAVGIACGLPIVEHVCRVFDERLKVEMIPGFHLELIEGRFSDHKLAPLLRVRGPMRSLLAAERTLLNFVQRMSGIATLTGRYVRRIEGTRAQIFDTRKTLPGYRALDKYAVLTGGGANHRVGLYDMVLVKDNHVAQLDRREWGNQLESVVSRSKAVNPSLPIEIEVVDFAGFERVLAIKGVDIILLDNMDCPTMRRCVSVRDAAGLRDRVQLEASGGVTLETVHDIALTGVERISVGAITHSISALDISLEIENQ
jgi:nicotinate-nucleotide pyrophosphorylase (carboxylating)